MLTSQLEEVPDEFFCPISQEIMENPVLAADGHTYEKENIDRWLQNGRKTSPLTGERLKHELLTPNFTLKKLINSFKEKQPTILLKKQTLADQDVALRLSEEMFVDYKSEIENEKLRITTGLANQVSNNKRLERQLTEEGKEKELLKKQILELQKKLDKPGLGFRSTEVESSKTEPKYTTDEAITRLRIITRTLNNPNLILWVDDNPQNNSSIVNIAEASGISCVQCVNTEDALVVLKACKSVTQFAGFKIVTDMVRIEKGKVNVLAGVDLIKAVRSSYRLTIPIIVYCGDATKATENCYSQGVSLSNINITASEQELTNLILY